MVIDHMDYASVCIFIPSASIDFGFDFPPGLYIAVSGYVRGGIQALSFTFCQYIGFSDTYDIFMDAYQPGFGSLGSCCGVLSKVFTARCYLF